MWSKRCVPTHFLDEAFNFKRFHRTLRVLFLEEKQVEGDGMRPRRMIKDLKRDTRSLSRMIVWHGLPRRHH
jgi:hypothetical protein